MSAEGWICPLCRCGVAPYELRCPCAGQEVFGGRPPPWPPHPMEPPFDWIAAIENVHVGPMVEVVDGVARAVELNPDATCSLGYVLPKTGKTSIGPIPRSVVDQWTEEELRAMTPGQRFSAIFGGQDPNSPVVQSK